MTSRLTVLDFACPKCKAAKGNPCVTVSETRYGPAGREARRFHPDRYALVPEPEHGTYQRAQRHLRDGEKVCDLCKQAKADYMREYRRSHPADYAEEKRVQAARQRALARLAKVHPIDFARLYDEERAR